MIQCVGKADVTPQGEPHVAGIAPFRERVVQRYGVRFDGPLQRAEEAFGQLRTAAARQCGQRDLQG
ncbi:hypothetical protein W59_11266 [Rhodococcus opacus RKJ300 = JCM 13270]|uniref:Uncharacterized protein n=1 Tax=Rhodococcus opacus RKJ300 = JCM 13270 TaxID=1165867 RepID=I0WTX2_RHOOP|nr:hypothetical protein W59_11266 [Rhodococcus opacus RKJ300 = JCM 13270]